MIDSAKGLRANRELLKGAPSATYKSFDTSYITASIISREVSKYKAATQEQLEAIRQSMVRENGKTFISKAILMTILVLSALILVMI